MDAGVGAVAPSAASLTARSLNLPHSNGYYEYLPETYLSDSAASFPLLLFFHGAGEVGNGTGEIDRLLVHGPLKLVKNGSFPASFIANGQRFRFLMLAVQFTVYGIYPNEMDVFIEYARERYRVDASRIYLTGLSMGGAECWNYVGNSAGYAQKIAAMVPVAAYIDEMAADHRIDGAKAQVIASANLPVWSTHNSGDKTSLASWAVHAQDLLQHANPPPNPLPKLTIFNSDVHEGWTQTYSPDFKENGLNIYEWMLQYKR